MIMTTHDDDGLAHVSGEVASSNLAGMLGLALRRAQAAVTQDFMDRFAAEGLRPMQYAVLALLQGNAGLKQNQVSETLGIKRTNFVPLLDELERRGLAERRRVADDRRASALFLTDAGHAMLDRLATAARAHEDRFTARIGAANRAILLNLLARLSDTAFDASI
jgi:DNA-binding MarR family transcriptional regulator